jgi:hypothetical protein
MVVIGLSYFTCVFLVTRPFDWDLNFLPHDLDLEVLSPLEFASHGGICAF